MSVLKYDTANSAYKDIQAMQRYDSSANAWKECTSAQVQENGVWVEKLLQKLPQNYLLKEGCGNANYWSYYEAEYSHSGHIYNGFSYKSNISGKSKLYVDLYAPSCGDQSIFIALGTKTLFVSEAQTVSSISRQTKVFDISGLSGVLKVQLQSNNFGGFGLAYSGDITKDRMYLYRKYNIRYTDLYVYNMWLG